MQEVRYSHGQLKRGGEMGDVLFQSSVSQGFCSECLFWTEHHYLTLLGNALLAVACLKAPCGWQMYWLPIPLFCQQTDLGNITQKQ